MQPGVSRESEANWSCVTALSFFSVSLQAESKCVGERCTGKAYNSQTAGSKAITWEAVLLLLSFYVMIVKSFSSAFWFSL